VCSGKIQKRLLAGETATKQSASGSHVFHLQTTGNSVTDVVIEATPMRNAILEHKNVITVVRKVILQKCARHPRNKVPNYRRRNWYVYVSG